MYSYSAPVACEADIVFYLNDGSQTPLDTILFTDSRKKTGTKFLRNLVLDYAYIG